MKVRLFCLFICVILFICMTGCPEINSTDVNTIPAVTDKNDVSPYSPDNNAITNKPVFICSSYSKATQYHFQFYSSGSDAPELIYEKSDCMENVFNIMDERDLLAIHDLCYWRVRCYVAEENEWSAWSKMYNVTIIIDYGLLGNYYSCGIHDDGEYDYVNNINQCSFSYSKIDENIVFDDFWPFGFDKAFGIEWSGLLIIEEEGNYSFSLCSDDESFLFINNNEIVHVPSGEPNTTFSNDVSLNKGYHEFKILFYGNGDSVPPADGNASSIYLMWDSPFDEYQEFVDIPFGVLIADIN